MHGLGSRKEAYAPVIEAVSGERETIAVDFPGFGASPPDDSGPSVEGLAERMTAFFGELGLERPHVAGNSLGGGVALELARRGAVSSATAFSPAGFWGGAGGGWMSGVLGMSRKLGESGRDRFSDRARAHASRPGLALVSSGRPFALPAEEVLAIVDAGVEAPGFDAVRKSLRRYRFRDPAELDGTRLTVAWGRRDVLLPFATQSRRARAMLPGARHVSLPGCGHVPFHDDPEACARVLLAGSSGRD